MIRQAQAEDFFDILELGREFVKAFPYEVTYDDRVTGQTIFAVMENGVIFVIEEDGIVVGMLGGLINQFFFSEEKYAAELIWYVRPEYRGSVSAKKLPLMFEAWAKDQGAKHICMASLDKTLDKFYARLGYTLSEQSFHKSL